MIRAPQISFRRFQHDESGAALVEFAFVTALFFLLLFGVIDFARLGFSTAWTEKATEQAVRMATVRPAVCSGVPTSNKRGLIGTLPIDALNGIRCTERTGLCRETANIAAGHLKSKGQLMPSAAFKQLIDALLDEVLGLGPLEPLLADPSISDILVNGTDTVSVERAGLLERTNVSFRDKRHLLRIIDKIVSAVGRRIDESQPWVDARLEDSSRVNAIIRPCAIDGPSLSIRKFSKTPLRMEKLLEHGALSRPAALFLEAAVKGRMNCLISGGTGSGKTTMLNAMSAYIDPRQRMVTIEDAAELQLQQEHVVRLETRPSNAQGKGAITQRDLLINALRMRPDRIMVGEMRGSEAFDKLQAMNTGRDSTTMDSPIDEDRLRSGRVSAGGGRFGAADLCAGNSTGPQARSAVARIAPRTGKGRGPKRASNPAHDHRRVSVCQSSAICPDCCAVPIWRAARSSWGWSRWRAVSFWALPPR